MDPGQVIYLAVIVFAIVMSVHFRMDEKEAERNKPPVEIDLSDVPDFLPDEDER